MKEKTTIPICFASDKNYLQHLAVAIASILANKAESDALRFYILENTFTDADRDALNQLKAIADFEIHYLPVKGRLLELCPVKIDNAHQHISIETYFRLFIPELIPNENKIIYLDCDVVVLCSLAELYTMDFGNHCVLGVRDIDSRINAKRMRTRRYINAGVLLMNSKRMREKSAYQQFADYIANHRETIRWHDQDVLVAVLDGHIGYVSDAWNAQITFEKKIRFSKPPRIVHYVGSHKPWKPAGVNRPYADAYFRYLALTPYKDVPKPSVKRSVFSVFRRRVKTFLNPLTSLFFSRKRSAGGTYNAFRILGFRFKRRRDPLK
ncbi:MAG: glycosyltransferase family 8 protein [Burkholderiaceae bacterium]|jgi:lipopolysaccharide biosynthesis glycosyltransferase|nr:glycosyltransferase family 8 protein [Burkholderiaceae bacterium]